MKKLGFIVMSLMTVSFLASCGGSKPKPTTYKVSVGTADHLLFTTIDGKSLDTVVATKNQDFTFKMKIDELTNDIAFKLPTALSIFVGDSIIQLENGYTITETTQYLEADVTIDKSKITDDIKISGSGVPVDYYEIDIRSHGVNHNVDVRYPFALVNENYEIVFTQIAKYDLPQKENIYLGIDNSGIWFTPEDDSTEEYCSYNVSTHKLTIKANKVKSNIKIRVRSSTYPLLEDLSWKDISDYSRAGSAPYTFYIGEEKTVTVNNKNHKVRIIDFYHDYSELPTDGSKPDLEKAIGITFEFANLISDDQGYSLVTQWNDTNDNTTANYNYLDSSVRMALVGEKQDKGHILWAQKGEKTWSTNPLYKNKSVLDMLPSELVSVLKTPSKYININDGGWGEQTVEDKLFLLSPKELGNTEETEYEEPSTTVYSYYNGATKSDSAKKQVKNDVSANHELIEYVQESGQFYQSSVQNWAGLNLNADITDGGFYWTRSPKTNDSSHAWWCDATGGFHYIDSRYVYNYAVAVAPAFCI